MKEKAEETEKNLNTDGGLESKGQRDKESKQIEEK